MVEPYQKTLLLLVGLPGSGKSTLAAKFKSENRLLSIQVISFDEIEDGISQEFENSKWHESREKAFELCRKALNESTIVILDDNFYYKSMRKPFYQLARELENIKYAEIHIKEDVEVCLQRNQNRQRKVPEEVILKMNQKIRFEPLFGKAFSSIEQGLQQALLPIQLPEKSPSEVQNFKSQLDIKLRKEAGLTIKEDKFDPKKVAEAKKSFLEKVKKGQDLEIAEAMAEEDLEGLARIFRQLCSEK